MKIKEVYLQEEHYNPVCRATISGAWIAVTDKGEYPICRDFEAKNEAEARAIAEAN